MNGLTIQTILLTPHNMSLGRTDANELVTLYRFDRIPEGLERYVVVLPEVGRCIIGKGRTKAKALADCRANHFPVTLDDE